MYVLQLKRNESLRYIYKYMTRKSERKYIYYRYILQDLFIYYVKSGVCRYSDVVLLDFGPVGKKYITAGEAPSWEFYCRFYTEK